MHLQSERGFSLIGCVVASLVLGGTFFAVTGLLNNYAKQVRHEEIRGEVYDLQRYVKSQMDCEKTVLSSAALCNGVTTIPLRSTACGVFTAGKPVGDSLPGRYVLKATCSSDMKGYLLRIQYAQLAGTTPGVFAVDPATKRPRAWADLFASPQSCARTAYIIPYGYWASLYLDAVYGGLYTGRDASIRVADIPALCRSMGFDKARTPLPGGRTYGSPGNNDTYYWDNTNSVWKRASAAGMGNPSHFAFNKAYCEYNTTATACP